MNVLWKKQKKNNGSRSKLVLFSLGVIAFVLIVYTYSAFKTTVNVIERAELMKKINVVSSKNSELEGEYMELKNSITLELAYSKGFKETTRAKYLTRQSIGKVSINNEI